MSGGVAVRGPSISGLQALHPLRPPLASPTRRSKDGGRPQRRFGRPGGPQHAAFSMLAGPGCLSGLAAPAPSAVGRHSLAVPPAPLRAPLCSLCLSTRCLAPLAP